MWHYLSLEQLSPMGRCRFVAPFKLWPLPVRYLARLFAYLSRDRAREPWSADGRQRARLRYKDGTSTRVPVLQRHQTLTPYEPISFTYMLLSMRLRSFPPVSLVTNPRLLCPRTTGRLATPYIFHKTSSPARLRLAQMRPQSTDAHPPPPPPKPWMAKFPPAVRPYLALTRIDKPIGTLLLFYPTGEHGHFLRRARLLKDIIAYACSASTKLS